jgi:hypothetical protein
MEPERLQMDIYEVFWDARPALKAINAKVGGGDLSQDVQTLFAEVRAAVSESLPGSVALTRITTQSKAPGEPLRMKRNGKPLADEETVEVAASLKRVIDHHVQAHQEAKLLATA